MVVASNEKEEIPYNSDSHTIHAVASTVIETYYMQVKVDGLQYVSTARAFLSGMASGNMLSERKPVDDMNTVLFFDMKKSDDKGVPVICTIFNTFGRIEDSQNDLEVTFDIKTHDGRTVQEKFDISELFHTEECIKHHWLLLEETRIGRRSFLGNSGIAGPGRKLGKNSLVAVLSSTPKKAKAGSNWWGSPPERLRRVAVEVDGGEDLTYRPGAGVKAARGAVETLRLLAPITSLLLAVLVLLAMQGAAVGVVTLADAMVGVDGAGQELLSVLLGLAVAWFIGSPVLLIAGMLAMLITVAMKWICVGTHEKGEHALWSRFVWFDELQDTFVETVAAPWYLVPGTGTGGLNRAMRWLGADVGHGVWLESYWLPETDLCRIGEGATVGRGCVVQTHLFQDRVMSLDTVEIAPGATLGPHSVALPASRLGESTTIGPASLVMRGDVVPAGTRWQGNPIEPVKE